MRNFITNTSTTFLGKKNFPKFQNCFEVEVCLDVSKKTNSEKFSQVLEIFPNVEKVQLLVAPEKSRNACFRLVSKTFKAKRGAASGKFSAHQVW